MKTRRRQCAHKEAVTLQTLFGMSVSQGSGAQSSKDAGIGYISLMRLTKFTRLLCIQSAAAPNVEALELSASSRMLPARSKTSKKTRALTYQRELSWFLGRIQLCIQTFGRGDDRD